MTDRTDVWTYLSATSVTGPTETINGATTKTNSDQYSYLTVLCNGTGWNIVGSSGTWT